MHGKHISEEQEEDGQPDSQEGAFLQDAKRQVSFSPTDVFACTTINATNGDINLVVMSSTKSAWKYQ